MEQLWKLLQKQLEVIVPFWAAGLCAGSFLSVYCGKWIEKKIAILFKENRSALHWLLIAATVGAISPIGLHGAIPILAMLGRRKVPEPVLAAFIVSSVMINPNLVIFSLALGPAIAFIRLGLAILAGTMAGSLVKLFYKRKILFNFSGFETELTEKPTPPEKRIVFFKNLLRAFRKTTPNLAIGILLAALMDLYIPLSWYEKLFAGNQAYGILLAATLSIPLYYCGGGTIPIIRQWLDSGMSTGAVMAFMLAGPATKMSNLAALKIIVSVRILALFAAFNLLYGIIVGLIISLVS